MGLSLAGLLQEAQLGRAALKTHTGKEAEAEGASGLKCAGDSAGVAGNLRAEVREEGQDRRQWSRPGGVGTVIPE